MSDEPEPVRLPESVLEDSGWKLADQRVEELFDSAVVRVRGATIRYEDDRSQRLLSEALKQEFDRPIRFFATTRLAFVPSLPPGVPTTLFLPTVRTEAQRSFVNRLEDRGLEDIERGQTDRIRVDGQRIRVRAFRAVDPLAEFDLPSLPLKFRLGAWEAGRKVTIVTAGYPAVTLCEQFDIDNPSETLSRSPNDYETEFFDLLKQTVAG